MFHVSSKSGIENCDGYSAIICDRAVVESLDWGLRKFQHLQYHDLCLSGIRE